MDQLFLLGHHLLGAHGLGHFADLAVLARGIELRTRNTMPSIQAPTRSAMFSQENEKNRLRPMASMTRKASVLPVKPMLRPIRSASVWPMTPPAPLACSDAPGRCMPRLGRRRASMPSEPTISRKKPMPSSQ